MAVASLLEGNKHLHKDPRVFQEDPPTETAFQEAVTSPFSVPSQRSAAGRPAPLGRVYSAGKHEIILGEWRS